MSLFNFNINNAITISNDVNDFDYESALVAKHYNNIPNIYTIDHNLFSDDFWSLLNSQFTIKQENINVKIVMNLDIKLREQKSYQYFIHIETPDIFISFYDEQKKLDDDDYLDLVDDNEKRNVVSSVKIYFMSQNTKYVSDELVPSMINMIHIPTIKNQFFVISASDRGGFELRGNYIKKMDVDIPLHYGAAFESKYPLIVDALRTNNSGLYLLHGDSGTGKTTLIRKLISDLSDEKTFIYVPSYLMYELANPELISFISKYKESILILEDAEGILSSNAVDRTQAVSNILNISDGLLNDAISIQIIATFNVNQKNIDKALVRAGRLKVSHKFKPLSVEESNLLAEHLHIDKRFTKPTVVADIYEKPSTELLVDYSDFEVRKVGM